MWLKIARSHSTATVSHTNRSWIAMCRHTHTSPVANILNDQTQTDVSRDLCHALFSSVKSRGCDPGSDPWHFDYICLPVYPSGFLGHSYTCFYTTFIINHVKTLLYWIRFLKSVEVVVRKLNIFWMQPSYNMYTSSLNRWSVRVRKN